MQYEKNNFYDYFIIAILASTVAGTAQIGFISHTFLAGVLCLPFALKEVIYSFKRGHISPIILLMLVWMLYAIASFLWAPRQGNFFKDLWGLVWNIVIFIGLYHSAHQANLTEKSILSGLRILIALTLIIAFWEITTDSHMAGFGDYNEDANIDIDGRVERRIFAAVTYKNLNSYVTLLCMALPFLMYGLFVLPQKWFSLLVLLGAIVVLIVNSSRGGLMCLAVDLIVFALLYRKQKLPNKRLITFFVSIAIVLIILKYGLVIAEQAVGRLASYGTKDIMSDEGRWEVWALGLQLCYESLGFGWGVGSMQAMYESTGFWLHYSHNLIIEFLMQYGIWLLIFIGIMFFKNWIFLIRSENQSQKLLGWLLLVSFVPLAIIDDSYLPHTYVWIWFAIQFAIVRSIKERNT